MCSKIILKIAATLLVIVVPFAYICLSKTDLRSEQVNQRFIGLTLYALRVCAGLCIAHVYSANHLLRVKIVHFVLNVIQTVM